MEIVIPLTPVTKKNSSRIVSFRSNGKTIHKLLPSKAYERYEKACEPYLPKVEPISEPVNVQAVYYMDTLRRVDLVNLHEALHDILVRYHVLADDSYKIIQSTDGSRVMLDRKNPRTEVIITRVGG